ncbi:MAG: hypothetical protein ACRDH2_10685, partial [Anaerolineales bacterium]
MVFIGPAEPHDLSWRERLRLPFTAFSSLPRALRLVWEAQPGLTVMLGLSTLFQALLPAAAAWVSKLTIDAVVSATPLGLAGLSVIVRPLTLGIGLALAGLILNAVHQLSQDLLRDLLTLRING